MTWNVEWCVCIPWGLQRRRNNNTCHLHLEGDKRLVPSEGRQQRKPHPKRLDGRCCTAFMSENGVCGSKTRTNAGQVLDLRLDCELLDFDMTGQFDWGG